MEIKTNVHFNIRTRIKCPKCGEMFDKPAGDDAVLRCTHCGASLNFAKGALDDAMREAEAKVAGSLDGMGVPLPPQYAAIAKAKLLSRPLNIIGVLALVWVIFFPFPYVVAVTVCALVPVVSVLVMAYLKGRINFETDKTRKSAAPNLTFALAAPPAALAFRAMVDFRIFSYDAAWLPFAVISVLFTVLIFAFSADMKRKPLYILVTLLFGFAYAYGVVIEINCLKDRSLAEPYAARVLDKRASYTSHSHTYYIKLSPWGPRTAEEEISVGKREFDRIKVNDPVAIGYKDGYLGIPWFFIRLKR